MRPAGLTPDLDPQGRTVPRNPDHRRDAAVAPAQDHHGATGDTTRTHHPALGLALAPHQDDPARPPAVLSTATHHRDPHSGLRDGEEEIRRPHDHDHDRARARRRVAEAADKRPLAPAIKVDPIEAHPLPMIEAQLLNPQL